MGRRTARSGFTLIELLVVLAILALLIGLTVNQTMHRVMARAQEVALQIAVTEIEQTRDLERISGEEWSIKVFSSGISFFYGKKDVYTAPDRHVVWPDGVRLDNGFSGVTGRLITFHSDGHVTVGGGSLPFRIPLVLSGGVKTSIYVFADGSIGRE